LQKLQKLAATYEYFFKLGYDVFSCVMNVGSSASQHNVV